MVFWGRLELVLGDQTALTGQPGLPTGGPHGRRFGAVWTPKSLISSRLKNHAIPTSPLEAVSRQVASFVKGENTAGGADFYSVEAKGRPGTAKQKEGRVIQERGK